MWWMITTNMTRKLHTPEFKAKALKLAEKIGVAAAAEKKSSTPVPVKQPKPLDCPPKMPISRVIKRL